MSHLLHQEEMAKKARKWSLMTSSALFSNIPSPLLAGHEHSEILEGRLGTKLFNKTEEGISFLLSLYVQLKTLRDRVNWLYAKRAPKGNHPAQKCAQGKSPTRQPSCYRSKRKDTLPCVNSMSNTSPTCEQIWHQPLKSKILTISPMELLVKGLPLLPFPPPLLPTDGRRGRRLRKSLVSRMRKKI